MTALAIALLWAAAKGTALAALGVGAYLLARRKGPAAGSRAAAASLTGLVGIFVLAMSPWPRWWSVDAATISAPTPVVKASAPEIPQKTKAGPSLRDRLVSLRRPATTKSVTRDPEPVRPIPQQNVEAVPAPSLPDPPRSETPPSEPVKWSWPRTAVLVFAVGVSIGLLRLLAGLVAVGRLRRASCFVTDPGLLALLQSMQMEMGIAQNVELRETAELIGPATTGWKRPTLYLPAAWESWSETERRVVLAHELAHVGRGDYAAWVAAQLGVILHFYQPMAHWLVGRLRLEQELAADEWGARHAGGRRVYLTTLANLALKQEVRPAAWPVRSLFPTRKTLIRRIEMLRKNDHGIHANSRMSRALAPAAIALAVVLLAGLRGPIEKARAQDLKLVEDVKVVKSTSGTIDLSLIPTDAPLIAAFRPADLVKLPELKALYEEFTRQGEIKMIADMAEPESIEQVALVLFRKDFKLVGNLDEKDLIDAGAIIVRTNKPREVKAWLLVAGLPSVKATHEGKDYYRVSQGDNASASASIFAYYQPDDLTIVAASEANIKAMIGGEKPKSDLKWGEALRKAGRGHALLAMDVAWVRGQMKPVLDEQDKEGLIGLAMGPISPLQELVDRQVVTLDGTDGLSIVSENFCFEEKGAERVRRTIDALVVLGQNAVGPAFESSRNRLKGELGAMAPLLDLAEQAMKQGTVEREGTVVRFKTSVKGPLVQKIRSVIEAK